MPTKNRQIVGGIAEASFEIPVDVKASALVDLMVAPNGNIHYDSTSFSLRVIQKGKRE